MSVADKSSHTSTREKPLLVDEYELADLLGVSRPTVRNWVAAGCIHPVELPGRIRRNLYRRADVEAWVAGLEVSA